MEYIDARRALELITDVVDQYGEDTVYEKVDLVHGGTGCQYQSNGTPSCLVGIALSRAGMPSDGLYELDDFGIAADMLSSHVDHVKDDAALVFWSAQHVQDSGGTWGEALASARKKYEKLMGEQ